ncbi:hypothetical protein CCACVL1_17295 [Corchorus capsularis]|uniref:TIR domain-containing protein n=1 Tax=Corchorus capsularis TaxID=210143 RepID=A0A1R3HST0_COCAP|nr:hypothetical protein CCACVL1_17295 [Corchorus capsularis]
MSALPCSSSSFPQRKFEYDIFLSFSGKDTRHSFTDHLYTALIGHGIKSFRDDKSLKKGKDFAQDLLRAIRESRGSIIVFSKQYALSRWCLDELVEIMKQRKERDLVVYPIFYRVEPTDFRHITNTVRAAFDGHEGKYDKEKTKGWEDALKVVADQSESLKILLTNFKDMAYELDDIVDEFETHDAIRCQGNSSKKPKLMISDSYNTEFYKGILAKINEVNPRLKQLEPQINELQQLIIRTGNDKSKRLEPRLPQTSSVEMTANVYGRDQVKEAILHSLLQNDDEANFVISIVGMGGIGKTTLAQLVYNDAHVEHHFDLQAWVCVSDDFDVTRITKQMLESITCQTCNDNTLNILQPKLKRELSKKRFLIVLDDVWNEDPHKWKILQSPFLRTPGSKIIVTTRNHNVSSIMGACHAHSLQLLSHDDALSIFAQHAKAPRDFEGYPHNLMEVAKKIVTKCNGLPLAAEILGGLLSTVHLDDWEDVLENGIWKLPESQCNIILALRVSYHYLPPHLKQCFAYCSIFPKDCEFEEEIILLWSAEGLLRGARGKKCFDDLLSRSLLQKSKKYNSRFVMHDLVHDLAQLVAGEICFRKDGDDKQILKRTRYLSVDRKYFDIQELKGIREAKHLRTILPICLDVCGPISQESYNVLWHLRCLRVLSFKGYKKTYVLPDDIFGDLKHLRYLDFSETEIRSLPESVTTLYNLETLLLVECRQLEELPPMTENLVNLHHLNLTKTDKLEGMPNALKAKIADKSGLDELVLDWHSRSQQIADQGYRGIIRLAWQKICEYDTPKILDLLEPSKQLKKLGILNYGGSKLAKWVRNSSLTNLESLYLFNCHNCSSLPSLGGLPFLKNVSINTFRKVTSVGVELLGENTTDPFQALEVLDVGNMPKWKIWNFSKVDDEARKFPKFRELYIRDCPELLLLVSLPKQLYNLEELEIESCGNLVISIASLPRLSKLKISSCGEVVCKGFENHTSLQKMSFIFIDKLTCAAECERLEKLSTTMLRELELRCCENLISLSKNNLLLNVKRLTISNCRIWKFLWEGDSSNACLIEEIYISHCPFLVPLSSKCELPASVKKLIIWGCLKLESVAQEIQRNSSLESIIIQLCPNLASLPQGLNKLSLCRKFAYLIAQSLFPFQKIVCFAHTQTRNFL